MKIDEQGNAVPGPTSVMPQVQLAGGGFRALDDGEDDDDDDDFLLPGEGENF
jgi:DNA-directed RNA polymerase subunit alpha